MFLHIADVAASLPSFNASAAAKITDLVMARIG
jgi:hypothetical protein